MRTLLATFAALYLLLAPATAASAQILFFDSLGGTNLGPPKGLFPIHGNVCHGLKGAASGLCLAYCEALECSSDTPRVAPAACDRLASLFGRIHGGVLPCDCPCIGRVPNFLEALNGEHGIDLCVDAVLIPPDAAVVTLLVTDLGLVGSQTQFDIGGCGFPAGEFLLITRQEAEQCNALVRQKAAEAGLACGPP